MATEKRLIDANALDERLETLKVRYKAQGRDAVAEDYNFVQTVLLTAPTVDAVEVVHGRWHDVYQVSSWCSIGHCSACEKRAMLPLRGVTPYCPNCGAKMDGDGNG